MKLNKVQSFVFLWFGDVGRNIRILMGGKQIERNKWLQMEKIVHSRVWMPSKENEKLWQTLSQAWQTHLPNCPGQEKIAVGQVFLKTTCPIGQLMFSPIKLPKVYRDTPSFMAGKFDKRFAVGQLISLVQQGKKNRKKFVSPPDRQLKYIRTI